MQFARFNKDDLIYTRKLVYIPRLNITFNERDIMDIIYNSNVGLPLYADITAVKDNSPDAGPNPPVKYYSAFAMIYAWNPIALDEFNQTGQLKIWNDPSRRNFLMLFPAKEGSEIPRSKVNTHQLAHYTSELYKRMDDAEKNAETQAKMIEDQSKIIEHQNERMAHMLETMETLLIKNEKLTSTVMYMDTHMAKLTSIVSYIDTFMTVRFAEGDDRVGAQVKLDLEMENLTKQFEKMKIEE